MRENLLEAFNVAKWIDEAKERATTTLLRHDRVWSEEMLVKLFDGPTPMHRSDFHINTSPEFFFQLKGDLRCILRTEGKVEELTIREGEMYLLPPLIPHLNQRPAGSLGLVIHQRRAPGALDSVAWYCDDCGTQLHRVDYWFESLLEQLPPLVRAFLEDDALRTCSECGWEFPAERGRM